MKITNDDINEEIKKYNVSLGTTLPPAARGTNYVEKSFDIRRTRS